MINDKEKYLSDMLKDNGINLDDDKIKKLVIFYDELIEKNKVMNLTAITDFEDVCRKHFLDSLSIVRLNDIKGFECFNNNGFVNEIKLLDVGCGAGFPGLVIAIAFPDINVTLLDSLNKRINFLNEMIKKLALANCETVHSRAEDAAKNVNYREAFDIAVSRAVANLSTLSEYCIPFVKIGGCFTAYKSEKIKTESEEAQNAIKLLGGKYETEDRFIIKNDSIIDYDNIELNDTEYDNENEDRCFRDLYVIRKINTTPRKYPRKAGLPSKEPL